MLCPISDTTYLEILQQSDPLTLKASAIIIDELSMGVSLLSTQERLQFEILHFIEKTTKGDDFVHASDIFVWSKVSDILGLTHPVTNSFSSEEQLVIQKSFFDHMWKMSFADIIEIMTKEDIARKTKPNDISDTLNLNKTRYINQNNSFEQLFRSEFAGIADLYNPLFENAFVYLFEKKMGRKPSKHERIESESLKISNLIYKLFEKNKLGTYLPSLVIGAGLHALVRHDNRRKFKANDMPDFHHAMAALPYYNYFFTERNLRDLVTRKIISFDAKYRCRTLSAPCKIVEELSRL